MLTNRQRIEEDEKCYDDVNLFSLITFNLFRVVKF